MRTRGYQIRRATERDIPALLACLREAFEPYREEYTPAAFIDTVLTERMAQERLESMSVFVAVDPSGFVQGTIAAGHLSETEGHLRGMAVLPEMQGSGLAGELLARALEHLAVTGCRRVTLGTTGPLARAMRFYEKNGFRRTGEAVDFFGMPLHVYSLTLSPAKDARSARDRPPR